MQLMWCSADICQKIAWNIKENSILLSILLLILIFLYKIFEQFNSKPILTQYWVFTPTMEWLGKDCIYGTWEILFDLSFRVYAASLLM